MKKLFIVLTSVLGLTVANGQQNKTDSLLSLLKKDKGDTNKVIHLNILSGEYLDNGVFDSTLYYSDIALKLGRQLDFSRGIATALSNSGIIYMIKGNYPDALKNHFAALQILEKNGNKVGIGNSYRQIGSVYLYQGNLNDALKYHRQALEIMNELGNKKGIAQSYNVIGAIYMNQNNFTDAISNFNTSLKIMEELGIKIGMASCYNNLGDLYMKKGDYTNSLEHHFAALKIKEEMNDQEGIASSYINIGGVYLLTKKYTDSRKYLEKALDISKGKGTKDRIKECYSLLSKLDSTMGDWKAAYIDNTLYNLYKDSLLNEDNIKQTERVKNEYEFDKKTAVLKEQQERERVVAEEKSRKQKIIIYSVIGGLLLVVAFASLIFRSLRITRKQKQIIEVQKIEVEKSKHIIEEKNKDITDSINYAKRIQSAKLPDRKEIYNALPNSFVLFKPKDIVSGDFYFFHKNDKCVFIASADCTGHGVPGAFMSMIGSEKLDDALAHSTDTSEILSHLNKGIKTSLHQTDSDGSTRDGMDIALCSVTTDNCVVKYAGANRPLWIIRNGQTVVEEIKATKKAIGGFTEDSQHFDTHIVQLQHGDTFYIFSDGYADTFSGADSKKLTTKKFKEILLSIQDKSMQDQELHLDNFVENWKAGTEQVDDILVIGVRM